SVRSSIGIDIHVAQRGHDFGREQAHAFAGELGGRVAHREVGYERAQTGRGGDLLEAVAHGRRTADHDETGLLDHFPRCKDARPRGAPPLEHTAYGFHRRMTGRRLERVAVLEQVARVVPEVRLVLLDRAGVGFGHVDADTPADLVVSRGVAVALAGC